MSDSKDSSNRMAAGSLRERAPGRLVIPARRVLGALLLEARRVARPADSRESDALYAPLPEPRDQVVRDIPAESDETRRGVVEYDIS